MQEKTIGQIIKETAQKRGLSMYKLSLLTGIAAQSLSRIVVGRVAVPKKKTLVKIADVLHVSVEELSGGYYSQEGESVADKSSQTVGHSVAVCDLQELYRCWKNAQPNEEGYDFPASDYIKLPFNSDDGVFFEHVAVRIDDAAMEPEITRGDIVVVNLFSPANLLPVEDGDLVLCIIGENEGARFAIRKYEKGEGADYWLIAKNENWRGTKEHKNLPIAGTVNCLIRRYE